MRKLLCVWEHGASIGHLANLRLPIEVALAQGLEVVLAAHDLSRVHEVLGDLSVAVFQAPFVQSRRFAPKPPIQSFSQLLGEQCFGSPQELGALLSYWRKLFAQCAPTALLAEHAPSALLAAHGSAVPALQIGTGFTIPPWSGSTEEPFAPFDSSELSAGERRGLISYDVDLLRKINEVLVTQQFPPLLHIGAMFPPPNRSFLLTWPELDHFGAREGVKYFGPGGSPPAQMPEWSVHPGAKLFVYLQNFPSAEGLLCDLQASGANALVYIKNLPEELRQKYQGVGMQFVDHVVDLQGVAHQAQCAITHGSHNTSSSLLTAGLPQLFIPLHQEQLMFGMRLVRQGCAAMAFQDQPSYQTAIRALLSNEGLHANAKVVGSKLPVYDKGRLRTALVEAFATGG